MSSHQKEYLQKWNVPLKKIVVIPPSFGKKNNTIVKSKNNSKQLKFVSVFRMTGKKIITDTLQYVKKIKESGVDFSYDIYGGGSDIGHLYYLIDKFNLGDYVNVKGVIDNNDLKKKLCNYNFFVQLSLSESLGVSLLEAQSNGIPCIVSNNGGLPEAVLDNKTGIVVNNEDLDDLVDRTLKLWDDSSEYEKYSNNAIKFVNDNFSIEQEIKKLSALYANVLAK